MTRKRKKQNPGDAPERYWLNRKHAARASGVTVQSFDAWHVKPITKIGRKTFFLVSDIVDNRVSSALAKAEVSRPPIGEAEADREKMLLTREQRIAQELKNAKHRREVAPIALIDWTLSNVAGQISAILESIPLKVKQLLPKMTAAEIGIMEREIIKAQNAAANITIDFDEYDRQQPTKANEDEPQVSAG